MNQKKKKIQIDLTDVNSADLSGLIKLFFKELPDPLFTSALYKNYVAAACNFFSVFSFFFFSFL